MTEHRGGPPPHYITIDDETKTLTEWVREYGPLTGITQELVRDRINRGWDPETAVTKPVKKYRDNQERIGR